MIAPINNIADIRQWYIRNHGPLPTITAASGPESREVSWWHVHQRLHPTAVRLARGETVPLLGTPAWVDLDPADRLSIAAVYRAAEWWALQQQAQQTRLIDASHNVAEGTDWGVEARLIRQRADALRSGAYITREAS